jgi:hydroxymethylglutaryl-CoA lyase
MATTMQILTSQNLRHLRDHYGHSLNLPILVPNQRGFQSFLQLRQNDPSPNLPISNEIAVFVAATQSFSKANLNCSVEESLAQVAPVIKAALEQGIRVRGYVSCVVGCPFEGHVDPEKSARVTRELLNLGCYEISLGDTIGVGHPESWHSLMRIIKKDVDVNTLAVSLFPTIFFFQRRSVANFIYHSGSLS